MIPWMKYPAFRTPTVEHPLLRDMQAHLSAADYGYYCGFDDLVTQIHEGTHGLQARIRIAEGARGQHREYARDARFRPELRIGVNEPLSHGNPYGGFSRLNAFYVFGDNFVRFNEPRFRKSQVGPFVAAEYRDHHLFELYVAGQQAWDDSPLYLLDEWNAYVNGAQTGESDSEIEFALIFALFMQATVAACEKHDPEYAPRKVLGPFYLWQLDRLSDIVAQYGTAEHSALLERVKTKSLLF